MQKKYDWLGQYHDASDPRLIVPKEVPEMGWTINVKHRHGRKASVGIILLLIGVAAVAFSAR